MVSIQTLIDLHLIRIWLISEIDQSGLSWSELDQQLLLYLARIMSKPSQTLAWLDWAVTIKKNVKIFVFGLCWLSIRAVAVQQPCVGKKAPLQPGVRQRPHSGPSQVQQLGLVKKTPFEGQSSSPTGCCYHPSIVTNWVLLTTSCHYQQGVVTIQVLLPTECCYQPGVVTNRVSLTRMGIKEWGKLPFIL